MAATPPQFVAPPPTVGPPPAVAAPPVAAVPAGTHLPSSDDAAAEDPVARKAELVDDYSEMWCNPYVAAERGYVDDVIDPAETRRKLAEGLAMLRTKREELPPRKHGNMPL